MKLNVDTKLKNVQGGELLIGPEPPKGTKDKRKAMTLGDAIIESMLAVMPEEKKSLTGQQKADFYKIACKAGRGGIAEYKIEELTSIKERIGKLYPPNVVGACWEIIESVSA